jgi:hypothetical protein
MAGFMSGIKYDRGAYEEDVRQSTAPSKYRINADYLANQGMGQPISEEPISERIDVDSLLRGITQCRSRETSKRMPQTAKHVPQRTYKERSGLLEPDMTRLSNPSNNLRGIAVDDLRYDFPLRDPQCNISDRRSVNTRQQARDNHRVVVSEPMDQSYFFPSQDENPRKPVRRCRTYCE